MPKPISSEALHLDGKRFHAIDIVSAFSLIALKFAPLPVDGKITGFHFVCPFLALTGLPCPFCGLTRSLIYSAHFQFETAWQYHVLGPLLFFAIATSSTRLLLNAFPNTRFLQRLIWLSEGFLSRVSTNRIVFLAITTTIIILWIARLSRGLPLPHSHFP